MDGIITALNESADDHVAQNVPAGHGFVEGHHDAKSKRIDTNTREAIDYSPPHERDDALAARSEIKRLEATQHRRVREILALTDPHLQELEAQIDAQRKKIQSANT
jgi:hypothetical protein